MAAAFAGKIHLAIAGGSGGVLHYFIALDSEEGKDKTSEQLRVVLQKNIFVGVVLGYYGGPAAQNSFDLSSEVAAFCAVAMGAMGMGLINFIVSYTGAVVRTIIHLRAGIHTQNDSNW